MQKLIFSFLLVTMLIVNFVVTAPAEAATYYQSNNNQSQIDYLYSVVAQLQAQLNSLLSERVVANYPTGTNYPNSSYGYNTYYSTVTTGGVNLQNNNTVELNASVSLQNNNSAHVWFEYGTNSAFLNYSSLSVFISGYSNNSRSFSATIPDLNNGSTYHYRAVVQNDNGQIIEGETKSFNYTGNNYNNNNYNDNYNNNNYNNNNYYNNNWTLITDRSNYYYGDSIRINYTIPSGYENSSNWIGLYRIGDSDSNYQSRQYLDNNTNNGSITFRVNNNNNNQYEFRIFRDSYYNKMGQSSTFQINN